MFGDQYSNRMLNPKIISVEATNIEHVIKCETI
jgi:hypothetical protein